MKSPLSVLLVEDNLPDARYVQEMLPADDYALRHCVSLAESFDEVGRGQFDVILLDLSLPDGQGINTFLSMVGMVTAAVPIIILTGLDSEEVSIRAVQFGAQDYILKNEISEHSLSRAIRYAMERKQFEEKSMRLAVLEQREEFMATLTHDLKNPLIGSNYILQLMAEQDIGAVSEEQSKLLLQLRDSNNLLISMIQNLIEVYRFEKGAYDVQPEIINAVNVISACITEISPIAKNRNIDFHIEIHENVQNILADESAIRRILQNLLGNALKFTPSGGSITLRVSGINDSIIIEVSDTGPGISEEDQKKLFQRFSQGGIGKRHTTGTGLGLYLCKRLVDAHRGTISCRSKEGTGTTFSVGLPTGI